MPAETLREQLEEAFNDSDEETVEEVQETPEITEEVIVEEITEEPTEKEEPVEDEKSPEGEKEESEKEEVQAEPTSKAPESWKPEAREDWGKIPATAQKEIARRETHMNNMIRESADSRKFQGQFNELIRPFEGMIAAQQSNPFQAVQNLMQTAAGLTLGSPQQKAGIIQNIMNQYGVDIQVLDETLTQGMSQQPGQIGGQQLDPNVQFAIQQQMAPINQFMGQMNQQRQNYEQTQQVAIDQDIGAFATDPKNEFFQDVRESMADVMDMAANRGENITIQSAYETACRMDTGISDILGKRAAKANADARRADIENKKNAGSSVHGNAGNNSAGSGGDSLRATLSDAWDDQS